MKAVAEPASRKALVNFILSLLFKIDFFFSCSNVLCRVDDAFETTFFVCLGSHKAMALGISS